MVITKEEAKNIAVECCVPLLDFGRAANDRFMASLKKALMEHHNIPVVYGIKEVRNKIVVICDMVI